jgi:hypothetical protein
MKRKEKEIGLSCSLHPLSAFFFAYCESLLISYIQQTKIEGLFFSQKQSSSNINPSGFEILLID